MTWRVLLLVLVASLPLSAQDKGFWYPSALAPRSALLTFGSLYLDGTARVRVAYVVQAPKTGTLDQVEFYIGFISSPSSMRVSFQDVSASDVPDGTQDQYRDVAAPAVGWTTPGLMTSDGTDGGSKRTVTQGDRFAVVFEWTSTQSGQVWFYFYSDNGNATQTYPRLWIDNGAGYVSASAESSFINAALKYNDGTYPALVRSLPSAANPTADSISTSTTPDEVGNRFTAEASMTVDQMCARLDVSSGGASEFVVYTDAGAVVGTATVPGVNESASQLGIVCAVFPSDLSLTDGAVYRAVVKPTTTTAISLRYLTYPSAAITEASRFGFGAYTSRVDAGSWTETNTRQVELALHARTVTGSGGGGGAFPFVGGLVALSVAIRAWRRRHA